MRIESEDIEVLGIDNPVLFIAPSENEKWSPFRKKGTRLIANGFFYLTKKNLGKWESEIPLEKLRLRIPGNYSIPEESPWGPVRKSGRSTVLARNSFSLPFALIKQEVWVVGQMSLESQVRDFPDVQDFRKKKVWLWEERASSIRKEAEKMVEEILPLGVDVARIWEFNKTPLYKFFPEGLIVLWAHYTHCGNQTVIVGRKKRVLQVPKELMGLVIGKGGKNIKQVQERVGYRIQLKERR